MMRISLTELETDAGKFVTMANEQDIFITREGKIVAKLVTAKADKVAAAKKMFTMLPKGVDVDINKLREERLK